MGASAALMASTIPWNGPLATVRVGRKDGEFVINPTRTDLLDSNIEMIVSGNQETVVMVEGEAEGATEAEILDALKHAHGAIKEIIDLQNELLSEMDIQKVKFVCPEPDKTMVAAIDEKIGNQISDIVNIADKHERSDAKDSMRDSILEALEESFPEEEKTIISIISDRFKDAFREQVLALSLIHI